MFPRKPTKDVFIRPRTMQHRVTLWSETAPDDSGNAQPLDEFATVYANLRSLSGREIANQHAIGEAVTHEVKTRYMTGIRESMIMTLGSRTFRIISVEDTGERKVQMRILAAETGQNAGA